MHNILREQFLPISIEQAWEFFSSPGNLSRITPPDMSFQILSGMDGPVMKEGQVIEYSVKPLLNIPLRWKSLIKDIHKPEEFTDVQLRGPYSLWEHTHRFVPAGDGVVVIDEVKYRLPAGILGKLLHRIFIRRRLEYIFDYRKEVLKKLFA